jgi:aspartate 1-decarboxylase
MTVKVLQAKIRNALVTDASMHYRGSITIDEDILDELGVLPWQVCDINLKGEDQYGTSFRGRTYTIAGPRGTGVVEANGALAYHISKGDTVHVNFYCDMPYETAKTHEPIIIESNEPYIKK